MSSISTHLNSYFSLNNNASSSSSNSSSTPSLASELAAVTGAGSTKSASGGNSFLLDLSDEAKNYLAGLGATSSTPKTQDTASFVLSNAQLSKLRDILQKYKDAPFTQATFNEIQDALADAGLGTDQLSAEDKIRTINPTQMLLSALNGTASDPITQPTDDTDSLKTKSTNFMHKIIAQWKEISTTADNADTPVSNKIS